MIVDERAHAEWDALAQPWHLAFEQAWASWRAGNFGIGAVLVDPADGAVVSVGRNRVLDPDPGPRALGGNFMAHAEMNAYAAMDRFFARGLHLYTTLEPCLMCAATSIMLEVEHIHFAARDEIFAGMDDMWLAHEFSRERRPLSSGPLPSTFATFARLLPLSFVMRLQPDGDVAAVARERAPVVAELASEVAAEPSMLGDGPSAIDAYAAIHSHLT